MRRSDTMTLMKRHGFALVVLLLLIAGCSAGAVNSSGPETKPYAPTNNTADGDVRYLNAGAKAVRDARRDDAYKKMYAHCGGPYEIVREEDEEAPLMAGPFRRIWFRCAGNRAAQ
jgi:hypothetical protein